MLILGLLGNEVSIQIRYGILTRSRNPVCVAGITMIVSVYSTINSSIKSSDNKKYLIENAFSCLPISRKAEKSDP